MCAARRAIAPHNAGTEKRNRKQVLVAADVVNAAVAEAAVTRARSSSRIKRSASTAVSLATRRQSAARRTPR